MTIFAPIMHDQLKRGYDVNNNFQLNFLLKQVFSFGGSCKTNNIEFHHKMQKKNSSLFEDEPYI